VVIVDTLANGSAAPTNEAALVACFALLGDRERLLEPRGHLVSPVAAVLPASRRPSYPALEKAMLRLVNWSIIGAIVIGTAVILAFALHLMG
jgi:hypothetical protein